LGVAYPTEQFGVLATGFDVDVCDAEILSETNAFHTYPLKSGGIACNMSANKELGHEASYARRSVAGFP
jgi:hypothetical protein